MRSSDNVLDLSATDLSNFLGCRHRTGLDLAAALGKRKRPHFDDPLLELLIARGQKHEKQYVDSLRDAGKSVIDLTDVADRPGLVERTRDAMRSGLDVIVQGGLRSSHWFGKPDILLRIPDPSALGAWSYEIYDTKLARETRAGTILQLELYSEMLAEVQGRSPESFHVITPDPVTPRQTYRVLDFDAYFRLMKRLLQETIALGDEAIMMAHYPDPVDHCAICAWIGDCRDQRRHDDHLSLVAGIARVQRRELQSHGVDTLAALAGLPLPLVIKPKRGSIDGYTRMREQARLQLESRGRIPPLHQLRPFVTGSGLCHLPEPSPGDIFLDLEGDPVAVEGGREYLFGLVTTGADIYRGYWAFTENDERSAFETVMDIIAQAIAEHPGAHVYHYAPYEPSAFKRLMGRYATREIELDALLRGERFVDLYRVVQQAVMAGVERYSIKNLEDLYQFVRAVDLGFANVNRRRLELSLEAQGAGLLQEVRDAVEGYNRDDCISTLRLRDWLEFLRAELEASGTRVERPTPKDAEPTEDQKERARLVAALRAQLLAGVPEVRADRNDEQHARWLLAYMLDWHRREDKAGWWEFFRLCDLAEERLLDEPKAVAGLEQLSRVGFVPHKRTGNPTKTVVDRYRYPLQEMEIRRGEELKLQDKRKLGEVVAVDRMALTIDIEKGPMQAETHPTAVFAHRYIPPKAQEGALFELGERVVRAGPGVVEECAAVDLLLARAPRLRAGQFAQGAGESALDFAVRVGRDLGRSVLAIQGPPGSGKTFTASRMICALVKDGKRIGVTGSSHKVIRNLLDAVAEAARATGEPVKLAHKDGDEAELDESSDVQSLPSNEAARAALESGEANVVGGTAWLWSHDELRASVDVLFVDEAGQMSLANALAVCGAASSVVLLGDPQQLDQPQKGSHPDGVDASALEHMLRGLKTIPDDRGIFLRETWRLCPRICAFTSEVFYESRLQPRPGLERQKLSGVAGFEGSGLWVIDVDHDGNRNSSDEEIEVIADLVARLTGPGSVWTNQAGELKAMTRDDVLIVAPYNAHVSRLIDRLGPGARVGTVDKFQGQEAPVVIYSMATSSAEDAPRGMEFLYSLNRLNVATSRARCAAIVVASARLYEPECRTPRQMKLANALCRYREMAQRVGGG